MPRKASREGFVDSIIKKMTLDDKVGQCLEFEFHGTVTTSMLRNKIVKLGCGALRATPHVHEGLPYHLRKGQAGDIQRRSPWAGPAEYAQATNQLQQWAMTRGKGLGIPLAISVDCEGDLSNDIGKGGVNLFPSAVGMHAADDLALATNAWKVLARQLAACGINMLHSPCVDISFLANNPTFLGRLFGDTREAVATWGMALMKALTSEGIIAAAKHYPGLGNSAVDTHVGVDRSDRSFEQLWENELYPYRKLIPAGLPSIMIGHGMYTAFNPSPVPASISKEIVEFTRKKLNFDGVLVTDSITMKGLLNFFDGDLPKTARATLAAGNDLILIKTTEEMEIECWKEVKKGVTEGEITEKDLNDHVRRNLLMKYDAGLFDRYPLDPKKATAPAFAPASRAIAAKVAQKCCTLLRNDDKLLPLKKDASVLVVEPYFPLYQDRGNDFYWHSSMLWEYIGKYTLNVDNVEVLNGGTEEDIAKILDKAKDYDACVVLSARAGASTSTPIAEKLLEAGHKVVVLSTTPYEYTIPTAARCVIITYGQIPTTLKNAADVIYGKSKAQGRWPLRNYVSPHNKAGVKKARS